MKTADEWANTWEWCDETNACTACDHDYLKVCDMIEAVRSEALAEAAKTVHALWEKTANESAERWLEKAESDIRALSVRA